MWRLAVLSIGPTPDSSDYRTLRYLSRLRVNKDLPEFLMSFVACGDTAPVRWCR
jgi:hypothetical protein